MTPHLHALPEPTGLPDDGPRPPRLRRKPSRPLAHPWSSAPDPADLCSSPEDHTDDPCFRRATFRSGGERRPGNTTRQLPAALPSPHRHPLSAFTTASSGRRPPPRAGRLGGEAPKLPGPPSRATWQPRPHPSALQEQEALASWPKSDGPGNPAPLAASPVPAHLRSHHARTNRHASGAREDKGLTARLGCRRSKHVSGFAVTEASPLERRKDTSPSAQTSSHHTVLPSEQGSHCQGTRVPNEQARHRAQVALGPGVTSVARPQVLSSIVIDHPSVCNHSCKPSDNMSVNDKPVVEPIFKPLPPSVVRMLAEYRSKHCRKGTRIRPWVCPVGPDVPLAASKENTASQQL